MVSIVKTEEEHCIPVILGEMEVKFPITTKTSFNWDLADCIVHQA
jgi:hypothetical protein